MSTILVISLYFVLFFFLVQSLESYFSTLFKARERIWTIIFNIHFFEFSRASNLHWTVLENLKAFYSSAQRNPSID